jgi:hypothetical protein
MCSLVAVRSKVVQAVKKPLQRLFGEDAINLGMGYITDTIYANTYVLPISEAPLLQLGHPRF